MIESMKYATLSALERPTTPTEDTTGGKEDEQHRHDVLIADALTHQRELVVKAQRAVLAARRQQRDKKDDYNRDGIKAHRDLEHILKDKSQPQVKERNSRIGSNAAGLAFFCIVIFPS